jgi:phosphopantetheinyl transferase (holo-ACP synthase)
VIGNDIVDLALAKKESNWQRKGFLDKIFTEKEQLQIIASNNPEIMVWNLWSRKEAAYKIYNRQTQIRAYIPLQLECQDTTTRNGIIFGKVQINSTFYYTKTEISSTFIYTIATLKVDDFSKIISLDAASIIKKVNGIPNYFDSDKNAFSPVSISHHGRFERIITC